MTNASEKATRGFIDFSNLILDVAAGDVTVSDVVKDLTQMYPLKPLANMIAFCTSGHIRLKANGKTIEAKDGEILICPPNVRIDDISRTNDFSCRVMCISDHIIQGLLHEKVDIWHNAIYINQLSVISISEVNKQEFEYYIKLIRSKIQNYSEHTPINILFTVLQSFLLEMCQILENVNNVEREIKMSQGRVLFNRFLSLLSSSDIKRQPITYYASQLAITPKYLTMLCLKYSNKTASDWVTQFTIEEIRFYLKSSNLSIKEISAKLGFSNMSHFGSYVRKRLGVSPSEFRHGKPEL